MRNQIKNTLFVFSVSLVLAACGSTKESVIPELEPAERPRFEQSQRIERNWSANLGGDFENAHAGLTPRVVGTNVIAASPAGRVVAVDAETGRRQWQANLREELSGGVGTGAGLVFVGSYEGTVFALDASDGSVRWQVEVSSAVSAAPMAQEGRVVVRTTDGRLSGLDADNGNMIWSIVRPVPRLSLLGDAEPLLEGGVAIAGFPNGRLLAVELQEGRVLWEIPVAYPRGRNELERLVDVDARVSLIRGVLYSASYQGAIVALSIDQRGTLWNAEIATRHPFANDSQHLYVVDRDSRVIAMDLLTGREVWNSDRLLYRELSAPASLGPYLVVADFEGYAYLLDKRDGSFVAQYRVGGDGIVSQPLIRLDQAYLLNTDGNLQSVSVSDR